MMTFFKQSEGMPMQTINLKQYYPFCKEDICVEVSDEAYSHALCRAEEFKIGRASCRERV